MQVSSFTVGPVAENSYVLRPTPDGKALVVDPGDEAPVLLKAIDDAGGEVEAILLTHTHFDHIGAVAEIAEATGAPVYCPEIEAPILADPNTYMSFPGLPELRGWNAEQTISGGERLSLAGTDIDVIFTPGHSIGHVTFSFPEHGAIFSGDVLFKGSVGRTDLPGGDWGVLLESIRKLVDSHAPETLVYPGHMEQTTLGDERAHNPFLAELSGTP